LNTKFGLLLGLSFVVLLAPRSACATERHFGFTYESSVLNPGTAEIEPWTTLRMGRADYYNETDGRLAFDYGLVKNLEGAFYWNFSSIAEDLVVPGATQKTRLNDTQFDSFSLDLKYKLSDPVADVLGSALYLEGSLGPLVASVEGRVILDKQIGSLLLAANLVGVGTERLELRSVSEVTLSAVASAGYFVTPTFVPSLEVRSDNSVSKQLDRSVLYAGPSVSLLTEGWWATLALQPQITAFKGKTSGHDFDLDQNERLQARLLFGFHI
jgi:hypothetical protein